MSLTRPLPAHASAHVFHSHTSGQRRLGLADDYLTASLKQAESSVVELKFMSAKALKRRRGSRRKSMKRLAFEAASPMSAKQAAAALAQLSPSQPAGRAAALQATELTAEEPAQARQQQPLKSAALEAALGRIETISMRRSGLELRIET